MSAWAPSVVASGIAPPPTPSRWSGNCDSRHPPRVRRTAGSARAAEPADPVVAVAPGAATAAPDRFSPDTNAVRYRPQGADPGTDAMVAHVAAAHPSGAGHPRGSRAIV